MARFRSALLSVLMLSALLMAILIEHTRSDPFHPSPQIKDDHDDIDPTGRGSPGIVIVYKKTDSPPPPPRTPNHFYGHSSGGGWEEHHHRGPPPSPHHGPFEYDHQRHYKPGGFQPSCANSGDYYCLYDRDYPMDKVKNIASHYGSHLSTLYEDLNHYTTQDYIRHDNSTHNYRHKGHFICESDVSYVRPGWAKNWRGEWVAVLNTDVFPQSVRIETCRFPKKKCEYMPPCYKSYCVQRYTYVKLICLDPYNPDKKPTVDVFEIPSACSCFVENYSLYK